MKSPFNWVGNKYKFMNHVNNIVSGKQYNMVVDAMMGSGNVILNIECDAKTFIGNDKQKLMPLIYEMLKKQDLYSILDVEDVLNRFRRFSDKESYYEFREYWNEKYLSNNFDRIFVIETALLLKMCSNSMVRFNPTEGYFNQGFRGLGKKKEFFKDEMKNIVVDNINFLIKELNNRNYKFTNKSITDYKDADTKDRLIIIDPPYILRSDMYDNDFTKETDDYILNLLSSTKNDFILFNYLRRGDEVNESLSFFIDSYKK